MTDVRIESVLGDLAVARQELQAEIARAWVRLRQLQEGVAELQSSTMEARARLAEPRLEPPGCNTTPSQLQPHLDRMCGRYAGIAPARAHQMI